MSGFVAVRARGCRNAGIVALAIIPTLLALGPSAEARKKVTTVAVFPIENLSGGAVPAEPVRQYLVESLTQKGVRVLGAGRLEAFFTQHRIRYTAGIDRLTAEELRQETGVDAVLVASIEMSSDEVPPKMALVVRLISIADEPTVVWADDVGLAGDDAPGFFELGIVNDYQKLFDRGLRRVTDSLLNYVTSGQNQAAAKRGSKFRPKVRYRELRLDPNRRYTVAVLPFVNLSDRRNAGETLSLLFMRHFAVFPQLRVSDTGVVRQQLLDARIIMDGGPSLRDAETLATLLDADFVLGGRVIHYDDYEGSAGRARVEFSTVLIERRTRKVVWSSDSYNDGMDGVRFFERGISRTAHAMATQMVRLTAEMIAGER